MSKFFNMSAVNRLFFVCSFLLLASTNLSAQTQQTHFPIPTKFVNIGDLSEHYLVTDTLNVEIENLEDKMLYIQFSLEEKIGDDWVSIVDDVYKSKRDRATTTNVKLLLANEIKVFPIPISELLKESYVPNGLCRLRYELRDTPFATQSVELSSEFLID